MTSCRKRCSSDYVSSYLNSSSFCDWLNAESFLCIGSNYRASKKWTGRVLSLLSSMFSFCLFFVSVAAKSPTSCLWLRHAASVSISRGRGKERITKVVTEMLDESTGLPLSFVWGLLMAGIKSRVDYFIPTDTKFSSAFSTRDNYHHNQSPFNIFFLFMCELIELMCTRSDTNLSFRVVVVLSEGHKTLVHLIKRALPNIGN